MIERLDLHQDAHVLDCIFDGNNCRLPDTGASYMVDGLRAFGFHFFLCGVCQKHFSKVGGAQEAEVPYFFCVGVLAVLLDGFLQLSALYTRQACANAHSSSNPLTPNRLHFCSVGFMKACRPVAMHCKHREDIHFMCVSRHN